MAKNNRITTGLKGMAMGMAEVVPGVSGGTIAFITGIYVRLVDAIKRVSSIPLGMLRQQGLKQTWTYIDGNFLLSLVMGMIVGILIGVFGITYVLEHYPPVIWGFFFGLIIGSVVYIGLKIEKWKTVEVVALVIGAVIAYYITIISPVEGSKSLGFVFVSGLIAICALILPGISGSFILLLLGMYSYILHSVKDMLTNQSVTSLMVAGVFIAGCMAGIMLFSRLLSWTLHKYYHPTLALLTGFMLGSLNRIWPWRNPVLWLEDETGSHLSALPLGADPEGFHVIREINIGPSLYHGSPMVMGTILALIGGILLVYFFSKVSVE